MQDNDRIREKTKGNVFFEHKYTRRKRNHDYTGPCTYHIILKKHKDCRDFGIVGGNPQIRYKEHGCARIDRSNLGWVIEREIFRWPEFYPFLKVYQHIVMP